MQYWLKILARQVRKRTLIDSNMHPKQHFYRKLLCIAIKGYNTLHFDHSKYFLVKFSYVAKHLYLPSLFSQEIQTYLLKFRCCNRITTFKIFLTSISILN